jgi:hypothetical protein
MDSTGLVETHELQVHIQWYLTSLQGGHFGVPTHEDLQFAGALHAALEARPGDEPEQQGNRA